MKHSSYVYKTAFTEALIHFYTLYFYTLYMFILVQDPMRQTCWSYRYVICFNINLMLQMKIPWSQLYCVVVSPRQVWQHYCSCCVPGVCVPGRQGLEQRRASEESPGQGRILTAPAGFTGDLQRQSQNIKTPDPNSIGGVWTVKTHESITVLKTWFQQYLQGIRVLAAALIAVWVLKKCDMYIYWIKQADL